jgi:hypothetical protein
MRTKVPLRASFAIPLFLFAHTADHLIGGPSLHGREWKALHGLAAVWPAVWSVPALALARGSSAFEAPELFAVDICLTLAPSFVNLRASQKVGTICIFAGC